MTVAVSLTANERTVDVAVIGAGVIGLAIAWRLKRAGRSVLIIDPDPVSGASFAAAGMLAPVTEFHFQEQELQAQMLRAAALWPSFASQLSADIGYRRQGTLLLGVDAADRRALAELMTAQTRLGLPVQALMSKELRGREPFLAAGLGGHYVPSDHQLDPRKLCAVLLADLDLLQVKALRLSPGKVHLSGGSMVTAEQVVVANGLAAEELLGLPFSPQLRAVHGDILRLAVPLELQPFLNHTVRGLVRGSSVYLLPRRDGSLVIGASQREDALSLPSAGAVYRLLRDAQALVPAVAELSLSEVTARARPATIDNAPLLGRVSEHVVMATGFFRHGVLLAPLAAEICLGLLDGDAAAAPASFAPERFRDHCGGRPQATLRPLNFGLSGEPNSFDQGANR